VVITSTIDTQGGNLTVKNFSGLAVGTNSTGATVATRNLGGGTNYLTGTSQGNSGAVDFEVQNPDPINPFSNINASHPQITVNPGSALLAQTTSNGLGAGSVTLKATNTNYTLDGLSFPTHDAAVRSSQVTIVASPDPATAPVIMGGAIDVESTAGDVPLVSTLLAGQGASDNAYASWGQWVSGLLNSAFQSLWHLPKLDALTLPLSVNYRNAATSVLVGQDAQITGSNNVTILANSTADAQGTAVYSRNTTFGAAIAFMMGVTDAETDIQNGVVITSTGGQV